jgi:acyl-CoA synthetase (AMP-forming)/AMP-acid ligase II
VARREIPYSDTVAQLARAMAARDPDRVTHVFDTERCRIGALVTEGDRLAAALASRGFKKGDVLAMQLPSWRETVAIDLACATLGLIIAPIIPIYRDAELAFMLTDSRAKGVFVPGVYRGFDYPAMLKRLLHLLPDLELIATVRAVGALPDSYEALVAGSSGAVADIQLPADAIKMMLYTSGTTGRPKAVLHGHGTIAYTMHIAYRHWGQGEGDVMLMASPVTHVTGFASGIELPMLCGLRAVIMERWNAAEGLAAIEREGVTVSLGATPFLQELVAEAARSGRQLPSLRTYICGGAAVPPNLIREARRVLANCRAFRVFGSSEAPLVTLGFPGEADAELAAETDGQVVHYEVEIRDRERLVSRGADGEIFARGPGLFLGYADAEQTAESMDSRGYFSTGDIGHFAAGNSVVISGRVKDLINRGGEKVSAKEVEDILHRHRGIDEAAIVAMPHARLGETVCAYVIVKPSTGSLNLTAICEHIAAAGVAKQMQPEWLVIVDDFPRTPSGKVRKDVLRQDIRRRIAAGERSC